ncbi:hypothetical protein SEA_STROSAHL_88 [Gordonia phage Strosahl]|uniref:Uncharacterized protein n=2 Tax=Soupsvirus strosahl TaxID=2560510 RepID=A0A1B3B1I3_9CAUD|nr:hypothetical protein BIZ67_gp022 [Gordonia phage Remus]YP_009596289.1 hypothetical protein FDH03_gp022 [Gordonia phage Strosahl]AOE44692.1 hypothetical protein SEA_REMUS_88 [Gordonia phage Remus]AOE44798.1 hypothetical protein SEA_STROSAHL_88 [Gordonia phage Strosahl]QLF84957.1 hypothetical protein SEA_EPSOCAMISIO_85 [Gordonia phage Epsocamisio]
MTNDRTQKMQAKVAKLLRQAEDVAGTPEEAIFQARAFDIMAKYGLDEAEIEATKQGLDVTEMPEAETWSLNLTGKYVYQRMTLLNTLAESLHCRTVYRSGRGSGPMTVFVFGVPRHLDRVKFLWEILQPQMLRLVETIRPEHLYRPTAAQTRSYRRAWIGGYVFTIGQRIKEQEAKALESATSSALVLYNTDEDLARGAVKRRFAKVEVRKTTPYNHRGFEHGQRDGQNAALNHSLAI